MHVVLRETKAKGSEISILGGHSGIPGDMLIESRAQNVRVISINLLMKNGDINSKGNLPLQDKGRLRWNIAILGQGCLNRDSKVSFEFITLIQKAIYKSMKFINGKMIRDTEKFYYALKVRTPRFI